MTTWIKRALTPLGRATVVKSLLIPKINYLLLSLPLPNEKIMKSINGCFFEFIWNYKPDKISRKQLCQLYADGGIKMTDIFIHAKSLKISWIRRFIHNPGDQNFTNHMFNSFLPHSCTHFPLFMGSAHSLELARAIVNPFWKEVLLALSELITVTVHQVACQPLWNNDMIKVNKKVLYLKSWCKKGVRFVNDILKTDGSFFVIS